MTDFRTITATSDITKARFALRDAQDFYRWALRHGNPGDCALGRQFIAEAKATINALKEDRP